MPNWADNTIRFEGSPEQIGAIREAVQEDGAFNFNKFIPCPPELDATISPVIVVETEEEAARKNKEFHETPNYDNGPDTIRYISGPEALRRRSEHGATDWYDWRTRNWGTKWQGSSSQVLAEGERFITVNFSTAWGAPAGIFGKLSDEGVAIIGGTIHEDGDEFELHGDRASFDEYFEVKETVHVEEDPAMDEDDEEPHTYTWTERTIELKG